MNFWRSSEKNSRSNQLICYQVYSSVFKLFKCIVLLDFTFFVSTRFSVDFRRGCNRLFKQSCRKAITKKSWGFTLGIAYVSDVSFSYLKTLSLLLIVFLCQPYCANAKDACEDLTKILKSIIWGCSRNIWVWILMLHTKRTFTYSKLFIETLEKAVRYVKSYKDIKI